MGIPFEHSVYSTQLQPHVTHNNYFIHTCTLCNLHVHTCTYMYVHTVHVHVHTCVSHSQKCYTCSCCWKVACVLHDTHTVKKSINVPEREAVMKHSLKVNNNKYLYF